VEEIVADRSRAAVGRRVLPEVQELLVDSLESHLRDTASGELIRVRGDSDAPNPEQNRGAKRQPNEEPLEPGFIRGRGRRAPGRAQQRCGGHRRPLSFDRRYMWSDANAYRE